MLNEFLRTSQSTLMPFIISLFRYSSRLTPSYPIVNNMETLSCGFASDTALYSALTQHFMCNSAVNCEIWIFSIGKMY